jgi:hypothetical protein
VRRATEHVTGCGVDRVTDRIVEIAPVRVAASGALTPAVRGTGPVRPAAA